MSLRNLSSKITAVIFSFLVIVLFSTSINAATPTFNPTRVALRCQIAGNKMQALIDSYTKNRSAHLEKYNRAKESLTNLVTRLQTKGYDVTKLKADLITWNTKILYFAEQVRILNVDLEDAKKLSCGNSEGEYAAAVQKARTQLIAVRTAGADVIQYYRETIKPDLQAIRAQKAVTPTN